MIPVKREEPPGQAALKETEIPNISNSNLPPEAVDCKPLDPWELTFSSWRSAISGAPAENQLKLFTWMAAGARTWADVCKQDAVDDAWQVAEELGLINLHGVDAVQAALAAGFGGGRP